MTGALLAWVKRSLRDLPWRNTRDPWAILISEVMLQQTQVSRVEPKYLEFLKRWPTPQSLANDDLGELLKFWVGLGFPRRARNLHAAARQISGCHQGTMPDSLEDLLRLPGVGPYTARAVMIFAFEADIGVVDTNVGRLLARWSGDSLRPQLAQQIADGIVPKGDSWLWTQGMFDFGSTICTKRKPKCQICPVKNFCAWQGIGSDPAFQSAGVTRKQSRFEGSDRQARGLLLRALASSSLALQDAPSVMGLQGESARAEKLVRDLQREGLLNLKNDLLLLGNSLE